MYVAVQTSRKSPISLGRRRYGINTNRFNFAAFLGLMLAGWSALAPAVGPLQPGVYGFDSSAQLTGRLPLDALNHPDALFIFQIGSAFTTASSSLVAMLHGAGIDNVVWQVGSSAAPGTSSVFAGNILADQGVTLAMSTKILCGRAIALNAAVTLDSNTVSHDCGDFDGGVRELAEPSSVMLFGIAFFGL